MSILTANVASGRHISYRSEGAGRLLVQVHGIGTGHRNFDLLTPHLATSFHVVDLDLPGYGGSDPLEGARTIETLANAVADFIEAIAEPPVHLHGTSFGGLIAMAVAAARPELVERLVVTCSFARLDNAMAAMQRSWESAAAAGPEFLAEVTSVQGFSRSFWDRDDAATIQDAFVTAMASTPTEDFVRDLPVMAKADLTDTVRTILATTLLLGADEDQMTPLQTAPSGAGMTDLARLIPNARLEVLQECGHFISIERGAETAEAISRFLAESD